MRKGWRSLFSLEKKRLNKKFGKEGTKRSLSPLLLGEPNGVKLQQRFGIKVNSGTAKKGNRLPGDCAAAVMTEVWEKRRDGRLLQDGTR